MRGLWRIVIFCVLPEECYAKAAKSVGLSQDELGDLQGLSSPL